MCPVCWWWPVGACLTRRSSRRSCVCPVWPPHQSDFTVLLSQGHGEHCEALVIGCSESSHLMHSTVLKPLECHSWYKMLLRCDRHGCHSRCSNCSCGHHCLHSALLPIQRVRVPHVAASSQMIRGQWKQEKQFGTSRPSYCRSSILVVVKFLKVLLPLLQVPSFCSPVGAAFGDDTGISVEGLVSFDVASTTVCLPNHSHLASRATCRHTCAP